MAGQPKTELEIELDDKTRAFLPGHFANSKSYQVRLETDRTEPFGFGIGLFRLKRSMPALAYATVKEVDPANEQTLTHQLLGIGGARAQPSGPYVLVLELSEPRAQPGNEGPNYRVPSFRPGRPYIPLWIADDEGTRPLDIPEAISDKLQRQAEFQQVEIIQPGYEGDEVFALHVVLKGCKLDYRQPIEGGFVLPLAFGLGPESVTTAVNNLIRSQGLSFAVRTEAAERHAQDHPTTLVVFNRVKAAEIQGAVEAIQVRLRHICAALAFDRGAAPEPLAYVLQNLRTSEWTLSLAARPYEGNLAPGFAAGGVTEFLDEVEVAMAVEPWIEFAISLYREILAEPQAAYRLFKAWSVVEAAAKRSIPKSSKVVRDGSGTAIPYRGVKLNLSHDLGRVVTYVSDSLGLGKILMDDGITLDLRQRVQATYVLRNMVAHEGGFAGSSVSERTAPAQAAIQYFAMGGMRDVVDWAKAAINREIRMAAEKARAMGAVQQDLIAR